VIDQRELVARITGCLRAMSTLSEASAARPSSGSMRPHAKSTPPPGVVFGNRRDLRDLSLHEYWKGKFAMAKGNVAQLEVFLFLAERDLARVLRRFDGPPRHETREQREARCLEQYEGMSPLEGALAEGCSEGWFRKIRKAAGVDQATGL
jgi:hypothetical protein